MQSDGRQSGSEWKHGSWSVISKMVRVLQMDVARRRHRCGGAVVVTVFVVVSVVIVVVVVILIGRVVAGDPQSAGQPLQVRTSGTSRQLVVREHRRR